MGHKFVCEVTCFELVSFDDIIHTWEGEDFREEAEEAKEAEIKKLINEFDPGDGYTQAEWIAQTRANVLIREQTEEEEFEDEEEFEYDNEYDD